MTIIKNCDLDSKLKRIEDFSFEHDPYFVSSIEKMIKEYSELLLEIEDQDKVFMFMKGAILHDERINDELVDFFTGQIKPFVNFYHDELEDYSKHNEINLRKMSIDDIKVLLSNELKNIYHHIDKARNLSGAFNPYSFETLLGICCIYGELVKRENAHINARQEKLYGKKN